MPSSKIQKVSKEAPEASSSVSTKVYLSLMILNIFFCIYECTPVVPMPGGRKVQYLSKEVSVYSDLDVVVIEED